MKTVRASPFHLARVRRGAVEQLLVVQRQRGQPEQRVERETGGWRGHPLFSLENLYRAYRRRRRRKRRTHNALAFERRLEDNLCALREELGGLKRTWLSEVTNVTR